MFEFVMDSRLRGNDGRRNVEGAKQHHCLQPDLAVASDLIFEGGELVHADWPTRVHFSGGYADFGAEAKFTAIGKLGGGVVEDDGTVEGF